MKKNLFKLFPHLLCIFLTAAICVGILDDDNIEKFENMTNLINIKSIEDETLLGLNYLIQIEEERESESRESLINQEHQEIFEGLIQVEEIKEVMTATRLVAKEGTENRTVHNIEDNNEREIINHVVGKGDTLWGIARKYETDVDSIVKSNDIKNPDAISIGTKLTIVNSPENIIHEVVSGETLWDIARSYSSTVSEIIQMNSLENPNTLGIGQDLIVPKPMIDTRKVAASTASTASITSRSMSFIWPVEGRISSPFGSRWGGFHHGLDIAAPMGKSIRAVDSGVISFAGWKGSYGYMVLIDHSNGVKTRYAHASELLVREGQRISKGEVIARIGSTGRSTGPHLHFEVIKNGVARNPINYLP